MTPVFRSTMVLALLLAFILPAGFDGTPLLTPQEAHAQAIDPHPHFLGPRPAPVETRQYGDLAEGPYNRLVIRNVMVIPGHGGPPTGPHDILIEGNVITEMRSFDPVAAERARQAGTPLDRLTGDRVIEGDGMYVMPGMFDLHYHLRTEPIPVEYSYYLKLAHGVTTTGPTGGDRGQVYTREQARLSAENEILAPRMFPTFQWGVGPMREIGLEVTREEVEDPANAERLAREIIQRGAHLVGVNSLSWNQEAFGAAARAVWDAGGVTTVHLPPSTLSVIHALDAARLGVTFIKHHYGIAESALPRRSQQFSRGYNYNDESHRFREAARVWEEVGWNPENRHRLLETVVDSMIQYGVKMLPTQVVYEASRDILRAQSLPWHEKYTHQSLMEWNVPSPYWHGAFHWDWTHDDEESWRYAFDLWGDFLYEFNKRGGEIAMGTDDNYIWATAGFSNIRELQLLRESGMHSLEVLRSATYGTARAARLEGIGLVRPGYLADLVIVDGNPAENFRHLYSFGAIRMGEDGEMYRSRGIVHTIKDGIVIENRNLMREVERIVAESRQGAAPLITQIPF
jgi:hypothetical protein